MGRLQDAKNRYDEIPIPEELDLRVRNTIQEFEKRRTPADVIQMEKKKRRNVYMKRSAVAAAAAVVLFTAVLNTNTVFAEEVSTLPVIGTIARVLTFRSYEKEEDDMKVQVEIPSIEMISGETAGFSDEVNKGIYQLCENYAKEAMERAREYREAFLATGGTEEEWAAHKVEIKVWYEVRYQTDSYLSLAVMGSESWSSAYSETKYYNMDLKDARVITLKDMLGDDYIRIADESISTQMKERESSQGIVFFTPEQGGFQGITDETRFYINESGRPVIVFDKYEIAPGAYGEIEFVID
ncbi:DUF3298 and DUF4163 domain-containing protein [Hungatella hathewayi]|uniref:DUF3298 domain-containing protein n=2 Tax=Hungatella hathewayi TaxID=154046 RepID=G5IBQ7_9FIRM|nr:DUF3298 and DUF4163 domain-containing protein [Hungatella hathewayi]EHI61120.1 hypothetical protein HMPREF9473_00934 [ [Hungatella hathewayi WAL-18680]MBS4984947.1 DUF3298 domain-containing protein [Hungatella hathewayi]